MNSLGKSPSKKKNKKNNWGKKPEVDREKIRAQTKQYYQDQYQEKEFLLKNTHNKEARSQLYDDNTLDYKKLTKPKGKKFAGSTKDIYSHHARQRLQERGSNGSKIRAPDDYRKIITVLPENSRQKDIRIRREQRKEARERAELRRFLQLNNKRN